MIVDLSAYQRGFDFAAFKNGGGLAAILKTSEGVGWKDPCYAAFRQGAALAGVPTAAYHFIRSGSGADQAQVFYRTAGLAKGERAVLDWEDRAVPITEAVMFLATLRALDPAIQLTVYGSPYFLKEMTRGAALDTLRLASLWVAEYSDAAWPMLPGVWPTWSLWQYSQSGTVPGFHGRVDISRFNGPEANALAWFKGPATTGQAVA